MPADVLLLPQFLLVLSGWRGMKVHISVHAKVVCVELSLAETGVRNALFSTAQHGERVTHEWTEGRTKWIKQQPALSINFTLFDNQEQSGIGRKHMEIHKKRKKDFRWNVYIM